MYWRITKYPQTEAKNNKPLLIKSFCGSVESSWAKSFWLMVLSEVVFMILAESTVIWRPDWNWWICFQDVSLIQLLVGGVSCLLAVAGNAQFLVGYCQEALVPCLNVLERCNSSSYGCLSIVMTWQLAFWEQVIQDGQVKVIMSFITLP